MREGLVVMVFRCKKDPQQRCQVADECWCVRWLSDDELRTYRSVPPHMLSDEEGERVFATIDRLRAMVNVLLPVARLYVDAFDPDEMMTLPERLRLQEVEDIVNDPDKWDPDASIGEQPQ